jgi:hypothetical protein
VPEHRVVRRRLLVLDALVLGGVAGVDADRAAVEDVDVPADLVVLRSVGVVAGLDGERQRRAGHRAGPDLVDLADHRIGDLAAEDLLRAGRAAADRLAVLDPDRRLRVDDVHVAELGERQQRLAPLAPALLRLGPELGADDVLLARQLDDLAPAADARLAEPEDGRPGGVPGGRAGAGDGLGGQAAAEAAEGGHATDDGGGTDEVTT